MKWPSKEVRAFVKELKRHGCECSLTKKQHVLVVTPSGERIILAGTPSCPRSRKNSVARLRRAGVAI